MKKIIAVVIFLYFLLATLYVTYPLIFHLNDALPGLGDELLITWILNWDIYAFTNFPLNIFNANIYYPYHNTLSYSDTFFTSALLVFFPTKILGEPAVAYNLNMIFSFALLGFFTYLLVKYLSRDNFSSVISGTLVAFSTYTLGKMMHPQLVGIQWIPLCLLFFLKFIERSKFRDIFLASLFFIVQIYNSFLSGYFLAACLVCFLVYLFIKKPDLTRRFINPKVIILALLIVIFIIPITLPYFNTSSEFHYVRDIRDTIHTANRPEFFFYSYGKTRLRPVFMDLFYQRTPGPYTYDGYVGGMLVILGILTLIYRFLYKKNKNKGYFDIFLVIGILSFVLSLGPAFQWAGKVVKQPFIIPLPYAVLYYLLPGFKGFRNSGRWEMLAVFAFSVIIGLFIAEVLKKRSIYFKFILMITVCLLVLLESTFPLKLNKISKKHEFPRVYSYINSFSNNSPIIELPMYSWNMFSYSGVELMREYYSTAHFHPMVNGASGFSPIPWIDQALVFMREFPNDRTINTLKKNKIRYLILHKDEYDRMEKDKYMIGGKQVASWSKIYKKINSYSDINLIKKFGDDYVYEILNV